MLCMSGIKKTRKTSDKQDVFTEIYETVLTEIASLQKLRFPFQGNWVL